MQVAQRAFCRKWGLASVDPAFSLQELVTLNNFVTIHRMCRGDTMQSLAVKYNISFVDIRTFNNLLSERALNAHSTVFVPVRDATLLLGKHLKRIVTGGMKRVLAVRHTLHCTHPS
jgi:hypothetical protein